ncbi:MAG: FAD-binding domain-containing protein [Luteolibacter sp.]
MIPRHPAVSRLSPLLRHRLLLEHEVAEAVVAAHGFGRVEKFVQEVYWRRYWKAWLSLRPQVWREFCDFSAPVEDTREGIRALAVMAGDSGNRLIDHFTRELVETGYLHNHARMWYAAWWVHQAVLPWQWEAAFFFGHLLDGDPASNTLSWRWVAGLQTPGKTYLARRANLEKYLAPEILTGMGDALADFENPHPRIPLELSREGILVPQLPESARVGGLPTGLWVHEEDLAVEVSSLSGVDVRSVLVTGHVRGWGRHGYSKLRAEWLECALADAACRAARHWRVVAHVDAPVDLARAIVTWAGGAGLRQIVAMRPEPGPLDDVLPEVHQALADAGVRLALCDRPEDLVLRPMAKRGFFDFWKTLSPKLRHRWEMDLFRDASGFSNGRAPS